MITRLYVACKKFHSNTFIIYSRKKCPFSIKHQVPRRQRRNQSSARLGGPFPINNEDLNMKREKKCSQTIYYSKYIILSKKFQGILPSNFYLFLIFTQYFYFIKCGRGQRVKHPPPPMNASRPLPTSYIRNFQERNSSSQKCVLYLRIGGGGGGPGPGGYNFPHPLK